LQKTSENSQEVGLPPETGNRFLGRSSTSRLQTNEVAKQVRIDCGDEPSGDVTTALVTYRGAECNSTDVG